MPKPYQPNDKWSQKAAAEGYRARSVYKLIELDERYKLLRPGMTVLDLGAAPGSWLQYTAERIGPRGKVIGIDLQEIAPIADNVITAAMDMTDVPAVLQLMKDNGIAQVDLVLSDLAPSTSGIRDVGQWKSIELSQAVVDCTKNVLKKGGTCVVKVLRGADFDEFLREMKLQWKVVKPARPKATRDRSTEVYLVMKGLRT